ncbi:membrane protein [Achromatium sp. WMS2]|nr:membrane protein [Achromatium sp. WMS2]
MEYQYYLIIGTFSGILAGLLGVGGGVVIVPALLYVFANNHVPATLIMQLAAGTSLATICATSLVSTYAHSGYKAILWSTVITIVPGVVIGAFCGSFLATYLQGETLRILFGVFVLANATYIGMGLKPSPQRQLPNQLGTNITGMAIGGFSTLLGIGGGSLIVPFLIWCNTPVRQAVATAAACGFPIAVTGTIGFIINGWHTPGLPEYSTGFIYWPAFTGIVITSMFFAKIGAKLAHWLPTDLLRHVFALFLCAIGIKLLWH